MKINERGFWENSTNEGHGHDEGLAKALVEFFNEQSRSFPILFIWDVGCGDGFYTNYINEAADTNSNNYSMCWGVDGNPNTIELAGLNTLVFDLSEPLYLHKNDWVLSLEVGEHIPSEYEDIFIGNLDRLNKNGIILSWAVRGQGGDGHVNCKNNDEVIEKISNLGYTLDTEATQTLRNAAAQYPTPCYWFRDTLMVFRRTAKVELVKPGICSPGFDMNND